MAITKNPRALIASVLLVAACGSTKPPTPIEGDMSNIADLGSTVIDASFMDGKIIVGDVVVESVWPAPHTVQFSGGIGSSVGIFRIRNVGEEKVEVRIINTDSEGATSSPLTYILRISDENSETPIKAVSSVSGTPKFGTLATFFELSAGNYLTLGIYIGSGVLASGDSWRLSIRPGGIKFWVAGSSAEGISRGDATLGTIVRP